MLAPHQNLPSKSKQGAGRSKREGFRPAGEITTACRVAMKRRLGAKLPRYKGGLRYEKQAFKHLEAALANSGQLLREPCYRFSDGISTRFCFPDALLLLPGYHFDLLIEIKTRHTYDAWWQLRQLYYPVVKKASGRELKLLEVVRAYDPAVQLPERETRLLFSPDEILGSNAPYNVYIWTGR